MTRKLSSQRGTLSLLRAKKKAAFRGRKATARLSGRSVTIVASRFNPAISRSLARAASETLQKAGVSPSAIRTIWVPGAFELPAAASKIASGKKRPDAIIAVGALIRGETSQYAAIAQAVTTGLSTVSVNAGLPVGLGVIVAETAEQARARAGGSSGNRGEEAALAVIEMIQLFEQG